VSAETGARTMAIMASTALRVDGGADADMQEGTTTLCVGTA
jgi:hypothetical protein